MHKVVLQFKLSGKTLNSKKKKDKENFTAKNAVDIIIDAVDFQFGDRPMLLLNEKQINSDNSDIPECYTAGWFISDQSIDETNTQSELVVIATGNTMASASKNMLSGITSVDWNNYARNV